MSKVVLIVPNFQLRDRFGDISDPPIGIASIAGYLERHGHQILIIDGMGENIRTTEIISRIHDFKPRYIGISCNYSPLHNPTLKLSRRLKENFGKSIFIFVGGNHATSLSNYMLYQSDGHIDCIARGEGETVTLALIEALEQKEPLNKIPGISYLENGNIIQNRSIPLLIDIDEVGLPAYHLLPMNRYKRYNIVSMRGCPFACSYCASTAIFKRKVRYRSSANVVSEIEKLVSTYGERDFWFSDDTFTINRRHTESILKSISQRGLKINWSCLTAVHTVQRDLLDMMRKAGCQYVSYGIETGSAKHLSRIGKTISVQTIIQTSRLTHAAGLTHYGFFIFGFPGETWNTINDTYDLIQESDFDGGGMNILIPLPGTKLWDNLYQEHQFFTLEEMRWDELFARLPNENQISFAAQLASRWCKLSPEELLDACNTGHRLVNQHHRAKDL